MLSHQAFLSHTLNHLIVPSERYLRQKILAELSLNIRIYRKKLAWTKAFFGFQFYTTFSVNNNSLSIKTQ